MEFYGDWFWQWPVTESWETQPRLVQDIEHLLLVWVGRSTEGRASATSTASHVLLVPFDLHPSPLLSFHPTVSVLTEHSHAGILSERLDQTCADWRAGGDIGKETPHTHFTLHIVA